MDKATLGRCVHIVEKNERHESTPGAPETVLRAAIVSGLHDDPNPDELIDVCVFTPSGPVMLFNVSHVEPEPAHADRKDHPKPAGKPGTWHWPERA